MPNILAPNSCNSQWVEIISKGTFLYVHELSQGISKKCHSALIDFLCIEIRMLLQKRFQPLLLRLYKKL